MSKISHTKCGHNLIAGVPYVHNCLPVASSAIHKAIPFELLSGKRVHFLTHLRVLGCRAYYRIPNPAAKLNDCGRPGILVGYRSNGHDRTCNHRVYDSCSHSIVETVDVTFDDMAFPPTDMPANNASVENLRHQGRNDGAQDLCADVDGELKDAAKQVCVGDGAELTDDACMLPGRHSAAAEAAPSSTPITLCGAADKSAAPCTVALQGWVALIRREVATLTWEFEARMLSCLSMTMLLAGISIAISSAASTTFSAILLYHHSASC
jgi:hypothetical protein